MNNISSNYCLNIVNEMLRNGKNGKSDPPSYFNQLASEASYLEKLMKTQGAAKVTRKDMTMDEYKQLIYDTISEFPIHSSQSNTSFGFNISEAGFEAMKNDPDYEKWVLDTIKTSLSVYNPSSKMGGLNFVVFNFGATKEEFRSQVWNEKYNNGIGEDLYQKKTKNGFWERRSQRHKEYIEATQKQSLELELLDMKTEIDKLNIKTDFENISRAKAGEEEKAAYIEGVPASMLLGLLG